MSRFTFIKAAILSILFAGWIAQADEGMWLLNAFPTAKVEKKYHFKATPEWSNHVRLSSARLAGGCSGSFVSSNGLIMTNHHCAHSCIEQLSTGKKDFVASGFYAPMQKDEIKCPEIEINQLTDITDVTKEINTATKNKTGKEFNDALKAIMSQIEKNCSQGNEGLRCDVVTLYHGGQYHLYKYKRYQDVRLVFAPEFATAFFGGDLDNFTFPRFDFDISFLRVYEGDKPLQTNEYFRWSESGAKENELTFVTGHPGRTSRLLTVAELELKRDTEIYTNLIYYSELRGLLKEFQKRGPEQKRISEKNLFGIENYIKALKGHEEVLLDKNFMAKKLEAEKAFIKKVKANPKLNKEYGNAWSEIETAQKELKNIYIPLHEIEFNSFGTKLFSFARTLVRAATELQKPNETRLREYADSALPQLKQKLFSDAPIYDELEIAMMGFGLDKAREALTANHPFAKKIFATQTPDELAESLIKGTKLKDVSFRKKLFEGGLKAIQETKDPMILWALSIDPEAREIRKKYEDQIETKIKQNSEKIAKAMFAVQGTDTYPDATFTLRLSYGQVKGYQSFGEFIPPFTTIEGAFARHNGKDPFALPESWLKAKQNLNLKTPLNFVTTNDIIGGNSGSPMINQKAEIVGLIFDGNLPSLGGDFFYDETDNRAVAVHSAAITELLKNVYGAQRIVDDLVGTVKK